MVSTLTTIDLDALFEARSLLTLHQQIKNWSVGDLTDPIEPLSAEINPAIFPTSGP